MVVTRVNRIVTPYNELHLLLKTLPTPFLIVLTKIRTRTIVAATNVKQKKHPIDSTRHPTSLKTPRSAQQYLTRRTFVKTANLRTPVGTATYRKITFTPAKPPDNHKKPNTEDNKPRKEDVASRETEERNRRE